MNDVSLLEDEVTRYHYFLQLKLDVIEGRLRCNYEQAIVLASYSLQARKPYFVSDGFGLGPNGILTAPSQSGLKSQGLQNCH